MKKILLFLLTLGLFSANWSCTPIPELRLSTSVNSWDPSDVGDTITITVSNSSNDNNNQITYVVTPKNSWLTVSPIGGATPSNFTIIASANSLNEPRSSSVSVSSNDVIVIGSPITIEVTQGSIPKLMTVPSSWTASASGNDTTITVSNNGNTNPLNYNVTVVIGDYWITVSTDKGVTPSSFMITADSNSLGIIRTGSVIVSSSGVEGSPDTIVVTQNFTNSVLSTTPANWGVSADGDTRTITVRNSGNSDVLGYSIISEDSWLTLSTDTGATPSSFVITAEANINGPERNGRVVVNSEGVSGSPEFTFVRQTEGFQTVRIDFPSFDIPYMQTSWGGSDNKTMRFCADVEITGSSDPLQSFSTTVACDTVGTCDLTVLSEVFFTIGNGSAVLNNKYISFQIPNDASQIKIHINCIFATSDQASSLPSSTQTIILDIPSDNVWRTLVTQTNLQELRESDGTRIVDAKLNVHFTIQ